MRDFVQTIFDVSPEPTPLLERINQESEALLQAVEQLRDNINEKQSEVQRLQGELDSQMEAFTASVEEQQSALEQAVADEDAKTTELKEALNEIKEGMISALDAAQAQMSDFQSHVDSGRELVEAANEAAQSAIGTVHDHVQAGREALIGATDFANQRIDDFQGIIDDTLQLTEDVATELIDQVDAGIRDTGAKVEEMIGVSFADLQSVFQTGMEMVQGNVIENGVNMALDELQSRIEAQLNQIIDQIVEELVACLGRVREGLFGNADEAGLERKMLEPLLDQLDSILDPLFSAVDHLKGMAAMVGISV